MHLLPSLNFCVLLILLKVSDQLALSQRLSRLLFQDLLHHRQSLFHLLRIITVTFGAKVGLILTISRHFYILDGRRRLYIQVFVGLG